jgi:hypothetical protein
LGENFTQTGHPSFLGAFSPSLNIGQGRFLEFAQTSLFAKSSEAHWPSQRLGIGREDNLFTFRL